MISKFWRIGAVVFGLGLALALAACGAGSTKDPFIPTRIVVFGDALSDTTAATGRYTVNDPTLAAVNNWTGQVAASYGAPTIVSYAKGNARVTAATGSGGVAVTTVTAQVAQFLAVDSFKAGDMVLINAGFSDVIAEAGGANSTANATAYGTAYANLVRSIVTSGAKHVAVANAYDLAKTPAAAILTNLGILNGARGALVAAFNDALKINLGSTSLPYIGDNVRLLDIEFYFNLVYTVPATYAFSDATTVVCDPVAANDATAAPGGIGIGTNKINSKLCTLANLPLAYATTYNSYVFADAVYPTPAFHRSLGSYVYGLTSTRW